MVSYAGASDAPLGMVGGMFVWAGVLQAQDRVVVKPDGTRITTHRVPLPNGFPKGCIALDAKGGMATIVVSRERMDRFAARNEMVLQGRFPAWISLHPEGRATC